MVQFFKVEQSAIIKNHSNRNQTNPDMSVFKLKSKFGTVGLVGPAVILVFFGPLCINELDVKSQRTTAKEAINLCGSLIVADFPSSAKFMAETWCFYF